MLRGLLKGCIVVLLLAGCSTNLQNIKTAATQGDAASQFQLGVAYDRGIGTSQDLQEAARWYRAAAEEGYAEAQNSLGSLYQAGEGVPKDYELARMWYQKAADQGNASAKNSLAYFYDLGLGVPASPKLAVRLYQEAAELGEIRAMLNLGILLTQGKPDVEKDYLEAYKWLDLARFYTQTSGDMTLKWRARGELDKLSGVMTKAQIEEGKKRGNEWDRSHRKK
ncbi:MAG: tetratricopeptide repeat protein [Desulfobacteraceae bacterium]|nr:tetratricopeptide repeat protein [Desulfobacteraceae bacterium]